MKNVLCNKDEWDVLSISSSGEAVVASQSDDTLRIVKLRAYQRTINITAVYDAYIARLSEESAITSVDNQAIESGDSVWNARVITLNKQMVQYVVYADACVDNQICVIEGLFLSAADCCDFISEFAEFVASINFPSLTCSVRVMNYRDVYVKASGISDVVLSDSASAGTLLFVGKNKYFTVSITEESQRERLRKTIYGCFAELISVDELSGTEQYKLCDESGCVRGVLEFYSKVVGDVFVEAIGYWSSDTVASISDNIVLQVWQGEEDEIQTAG